jgi:hypothetical protein
MGDNTAWNHNTLSEQNKSRVRSVPRGAHDGVAGGSFEAFLFRYLAFEILNVRNRREALGHSANQEVDQSIGGGARAVQAQ